MKLKKFYPLVKMVDQPDGTLHVYGLVTAEKPDLDKEVSITTRASRITLQRSRRRRRRRQSKAWNSH